MSPWWEDMFPHVVVKKILRDQSDHNLLILDSGGNTSVKKIREFKLDNSFEEP
jgi:hypothetical protein